ncbi:MAG: PilZ domain-containing protein [Planctomycetota bacterium]
MKFSLFRRVKRDAGAKAQNESPRNQHPALPEADDLEVHLQLTDQQPFKVDLYDMNIQGAEIRLPFHLAPLGGEGELVELDIHHPRDGWRVRAVGRVRKLEKWDDATVLVEVQFSNLGDLYAQLDDALGRYFNRRSAARIKPDIDSVVRVKLAYGPHRVRGAAQDLSRTGLGIVLPLVQAAIFRSGERVKIYLDVPGTKEPFEGVGVVKHGYRSGEDVVLGVEFDLLADSPMKKRRNEFLGYIEQRREEIEAWQLRLTS